VKVATEQKAKSMDRRYDKNTLPSWNAEVVGKLSVQPEEHGIHVTASWEASFLPGIAVQPECMWT